MCYHRPMDLYLWLIVLAPLVGAVLGCWLWTRRGAARQRELADRLAEQTRALAALDTVAAVVGRSLKLDEALNSAL